MAPQVNNTKFIIAAILSAGLVILIGIGLIWAPFKVGLFKPATKSVTSLPVETIHLKEGVYALDGYGYDSNTISYLGSVRISKNGDVYQLEWEIGTQQQRGVAILENGILSVGYMDVTAGNINDAGVVSYRVISDGKLDGKWSSILSNRTGREVLTWKGE